MLAEWERTDALCCGANVHATAAGATTKKGAKKRVCRIQIELLFYRQQVQELELKLKRLQMSKYPIGGSCITSTVDNAGSLWNGIAERRFKERLRAEQQQKELNVCHSEVTQFTTEMFKLFEKRDSGHNLKEEKLSNCPRQERFWLFAMDAEDEIYADQLTSVARLRLELQQREYQAPCKTMDFNWGLSRGNMVVKPTSRGVAIEMHCTTTVPFKLEVDARAYWRFFSIEHGEALGSGTAATVSTNTVARSFSLRLRFDELTSEASGKYTCQTHVEEDEITIVWVEHADVSEFGGVTFNGLQYQKQACMKLRKVPREGPRHQSTSSVVETHFETIPIFHDSVVDKDQQTEAFINSAYRSHSTLNKIVSQTMGDLLLEEDWKATFG